MIRVWGVHFDRKTIYTGGAVAAGVILFAVAITSLTEPAPVAEPVAKGAEQRLRPGRSANPISAKTGTNDNLPSASVEDVVPTVPTPDPAELYIAEGRRAILSDGSIDPEFWSAFAFTPEQRSATEINWQRQLKYMNRSESHFMTEPATDDGTVSFTVEPEPHTGAGFRRDMLANLSVAMPERALQYLSSVGGLGEDDLIFGASGRNRREYRITQSGGKIHVHEKQYAPDSESGWVLVSDTAKTFDGIPPRFAHLFEIAKH